MKKLIICLLITALIVPALASTAFAYKIEKISTRIIGGKKYDVGVRAWILPYKQNGKRKYRVLSAYDYFKSHNNNTKTYEVRSRYYRKFTSWQRWWSHYYSAAFRNRNTNYSGWLFNTGTDRIYTSGQQIRVTNHFKIWEGRSQISHYVSAYDYYLP